MMLDYLFCYLCFYTPYGLAFTGFIEFFSLLIFNGVVEITALSVRSVETTIK